ncbi:MAG: hypothetical protein HOW59_23840, partial [Nonomuraea sp.]|nr:hypothetical protein [Nonomuraea sp.]
MNAWEDLVKLVEAGDVPGTARLVSALDPAGRQAVAGELPRYLAALDTGLDGPRRRLGPLLVAGAGCVSGAAGVAAWLFRREFDGMNGFAGSLLVLLRQRPLDWQADVARRLARRMRLPLPRHWSVVAGLVRESGVEPPDDDAFKVGWLRGLGPVMAVRDPFFRAYAPHIFEFDGLGEVLPWQTPNIARLVEGGLLDRDAVLDGVVGRLLRDGPAALDALADLHDLLDPDLGETSARAADYVRLLPVSPTRVAVMALARLRRLEEAGRLADESFAEAVAATAFRLEKKVLAETMTWADEAARRRPGRAGAALCGLAPIFAHDALALQDRVVRLAVKLAPHA